VRPASTEARKKSTSDQEEILKRALLEEALWEGVTLREMGCCKVGPDILDDKGRGSNRSFKPKPWTRSIGGEKGENEYLRRGEPTLLKLSTESSSGQFHPERG